MASPMGDFSPDHITHGKSDSPQASLTSTFFDISAGPLIMTPTIHFRFFFQWKLCTIKLAWPRLFQRSLYGCKQKQSYRCVLILLWFFIRRKYFSDSNISFRLKQYKPSHSVTRCSGCKYPACFEALNYCSIIQIVWPLLISNLLI